MSILRFRKIADKNLDVRKKKIACRCGVCIVNNSIPSNTRIIKNQKRVCLLLTGVLLLFAGISFGQSNSTNTYTFTVNQNIPEGDPNGYANTQTISNPTGQIVSVDVTIDIQGGFNGGYYAYPEHDRGLAVLLNRPAVTSSNPMGYADSGRNISMSDSASTDVHLDQTAVNANGGVLAGTFQEDARDADPSTVTDASPRNAPLSAFSGQDPNRQWTLFLSDLDYGAQGQLVSWGMVVTTVPEAGTWSLMAAGLVCVFGMRVCKQRRR